MSTAVTVVGGGLAGCEAAWILARRGFRVRLVEMRPEKTTPAHETGLLAELVCSNSLGAEGTASPAGILKAELARMGSLVLECAASSRVPAGGALAVDRERYALDVTARIAAHPLIELVREECVMIPREPAIVCTGPLSSPRMAEALKELVGEDFLSFYDAVAPIVELASVDEGACFRANRWSGQGENCDYINCPLDEETYYAFCRELVAAKRAPIRELDVRHFEGCLPVEVIASRGPDTLRYGPMRPVGLADPRTGREPFAVVQLRQDNLEGTLYNLVGFQTNLLWGEQERVFRMIPALRAAEFARKGVMHRNLFVCAPRVLDGFLRPVGRERLFLAGQMTGVEGYVESAATGLVAGFYMAELLDGAADLPPFPRETACGSLLHYLKTALPESFQPMNVNLGIFPPLSGKKVRNRQERCTRTAERALEALERFLANERPFEPTLSK